MAFEKSCGAVLYTKTENEIRFLLIQNHDGIYGFPKGHMEAGESEYDTAIREVLEETGLTVTFLPEFRTTDHYVIEREETIEREIVYFLGFYEDQTPIYQKEELSSASLYAYEEAMKLLQFESSKRILAEANARLHV